MKTDRISHAITALLLVTSLSPIVAHAQAPAGQQPTQSLADAARKAREQNKSRQSGKIITNEDIANLKGTVSVVGTPPPPAASTQPNAQSAARIQRAPPAQFQPAKRPRLPQKLRLRANPIGAQNSPMLDAKWPTTARNWTFCSANTI